MSKKKLSDSLAVDTDTMLSFVRFFCYISNIQQNMDFLRWESVRRYVDGNCHQIYDVIVFPMDLLKIIGVISRIKLFKFPLIRVFACLQSNS